MRRAICSCVRATCSASVDDGGRNRDAHRQHFVRPDEARRDVAHGEERAHHQTRRDEQHDRQRDLRHDQRVAGAMALAPVARAAAVLLERVGQLRPRVLQHRDDAEQQAGERATAPA